MKLIDKEALKASIRAKFKELSDRCEINEVINAAPTIDAIPVEWLRKIRANKPETVEMLGVDVILMLWQNEQEAR